MSNTKFLVIYLLFMVPTYLWWFAFIGSTFENGVDVLGAGIYASALTFISYAVMAYVTYCRGKTIGKGYLVAFPIVGAVFDLILVFVPFVPTILNIITIVQGMPDNKPARIYHR